jgi:hypothetical protein
MSFVTAAKVVVALMIVVPLLVAGSVILIVQRHNQHPGLHPADWESEVFK